MHVLVNIYNTGVHAENNLKGHVFCWQEMWHKFLTQKKRFMNVKGDISRVQHQVGRMVVFF
jgi:hypothetical protein